MRIHLKTSKSYTVFPFNYQPVLAGAFHKWVGDENEVHDGLSLYSFSWLQGGFASKKGLCFENGASFFISAFDNGLIKRIINGIYKDPKIGSGLIVKEVVIQEDPIFRSESFFHVSSPVLVKRNEGSRQVHYSFEDEIANSLLTQTMESKLKKAGISMEGIQIKFDTSYPSPKTKVIRYKEINNKVNQCPIIISGSPEQIAFAWNVGVGNSTGIGFGALK
jgi:CRISPR-associated endoribonuclease Cas6